MPEADKPIADYAVVGDCHGAALVARDGRVDWACLGRFDADPRFCRLLNGPRGGSLNLRPEGEFHTTRRYLPGTAILQTTIHALRGSARFTDFMPVGRSPGAGVHDYVDLHAPHWFVRVIEGLRGHVPLRGVYAPTTSFGRRPCALAASADRLTDDAGGALFSSVSWTITGEGATSHFTVADRQIEYLVLAADGAVWRHPSRRAIKKLFDVTGAFWNEWLAYSRVDGPHAAMIRRSAITLKLLTYAPSGALAAAPTSSLPESPGGAANWDYRYCWLRDGVFLLYALSMLGYSGEAGRFRRFLERACRASNFDLQIMYGVEAETDLEEEELHGVRGYFESRPVRRGNAAYKQHQLDVFGEVLEWLLQYRELGGRMDADVRGMVRGLADQVARSWRDPDHGFWEKRDTTHHYTLGRVMAWVALDRAARLIGDEPGLLHEREAIRQAVWREGISADGVLKTAIDLEHVDASLLLVGLFGFPCPDGVFARTVDRISRDLGAGLYLRRYRPGPGEPEEGAFLACSFWMVSALLILDRGTAARALFEQLLEDANDVGLYSEEIDPASRMLLGNFPQALTHLALIQAAADLQLFERGGVRAVQGGPFTRARRAVGATTGVRGIWAALSRTGRVGRLRSSRASTLSLAAFSR